MSVWAPDLSGDLGTSLRGVRGAYLKIARQMMRLVLGGQTGPVIFSGELYLKEGPPFLKAVREWINRMARMLPRT